MNKPSTYTTVRKVAFEIKQYNKLLPVLVKVNGSAIY